jgi:membrane protease YdiL (CAAX protease family)
LKTEDKNLLQKYADNQPILFALIITAIFFTFILITALIQKIIDPGFPLSLFVLWLAILLLIAMGWWRKAGFNGPSEWKNPQVLIIPILILVINFLGRNFIEDRVQIVGLFLIAVFISFGEEAIFRGLILRALHAHGTFLAIVLSSILFAVAHFVNLVSGVHIFSTVGQVFLAFCIGILLASITIFTNTIWPAIVFHTVWNHTIFISSSTYKASPYLLGLILAMIIFGFILAYMAYKERIRVTEGVA